jgi:hypothetical protein
MKEILDIPVENAKAILMQEIGMLKNTRYQHDIRYKVNKRIHADENTLKSIAAELERLEKLINEYQGELDSLTSK